MPDGFDVVIVGAGPAGASCAKRACELGLSVVVLERASFPRSKPCAAGLTSRAVDLVGDRAAGSLHDTVSTLRLRFGAATLVWESATPVLRTTTRSELDSVMAEAAVASGALIEFGARVDGVTEECGCVAVASGGRTFRGRFVVGADGARSAVADRLWGGLPDLYGATYVRAFPPAAGDLGPHKGVATLDPTATVRGYGWVFPKNDHLNVGVFAQRPLAGALGEDLAAFVESNGLDDWRTEGPFAAPIPRAVRRGGFARGRALLAGDAAGLVNPVTGEGIPHAVTSGRIAAEEIARALEGGGSPCARYAKRILEEVIPAVNATRRAGGIIYALGPRGLRRASRVPLLVRAAARLHPSARAGRPEGSLSVEYASRDSHKQ